MVTKQWYGTPFYYVHSDRGRSFLSDELTTYLNQNRINSNKSEQSLQSSRKRSNRTLEWNNMERAISLLLKPKGLDQNKWKIVQPEAEHPISSLLCTATNCTPHERFFIRPWRSSNGTSRPAWLRQPEPVLMYHPANTSLLSFVDEAELLESYPQ